METAGQPTRRVRPWIAALLTFVSWGLGFFYARRTKTAFALAAATLLVSLLTGALLLYGLYTQAPWVPRGERSREVADGLVLLLSLAIGAPIAVWAWITAAQNRFAPKAGPVRLLGYLAVWLLPVLVGWLLAATIRWTLIQPFRVPSGTMQPTIMRGDYIIADKRAYGYSRYSFAPLDGLLPRGRWFARLPERGDIAVFRPVGETRDFVKRIVGMPGDRVQMIDGVLRIDGSPVRLEPLGELDLAQRGVLPARVSAFCETLPGGASHVVLDRSPDFELDNTRVFVVPADHYFMLGDDRDFSQDSRTVLVGYVPFENLVGRIDVTYDIKFPAPGGEIVGCASTLR